MIMFIIRIYHVYLILFFFFHAAKKKKPKCERNKRPNVGFQMRLGWVQLNWVLFMNRNWEFWVRGTSFPRRDYPSSLDGAPLSGRIQRKTWVCIKAGSYDEPRATGWDELPQTWSKCLVLFPFKPWLWSFHFLFIYESYKCWLFFFLNLK